MGRNSGGVHSGSNSGQSIISSTKKAIEDRVGNGSVESVRISGDSAYIKVNTKAGKLYENAATSALSAQPIELNIGNGIREIYVYRELTDAENRRKKELNNATNNIGRNARGTAQERRSTRQGGKGRGNYTV